MIPAAFDYRRPDSVDEAVALLAADEEAKLLAGGHSLIPMMRLRLARPSMIVDLGGLRAQLSYIRATPESVVVGAMTRHHDVATSTAVRQRIPLLGVAAATIGDPQVRHRGTLGGSLVHADPAADLPAAVLALDAVMLARGPGGDREIPAAEFFQGYFESALAADEVLVEVRIPAPADGHGWAYVKFNRRAQDWATVAVAALLERSGTEITRAAVALAGMGEAPLRAAGVEAALTAGGVGSLAAAAEHADEGCSPVSDLAASADYRRHLARVLTRRALEEALSRSR